jgi:tetratricopeptide (TPR) repeat protein
LSRYGGLNMARSRKWKWLLEILYFPLLSPSVFLVAQQPQSVPAGEQAKPPSSATASSRFNLLPISQPSLSAVEPTVKDQIEAAWAQFQAVSRAPGVDQKELGEAYGQMGKVYHVYEFSDAAAACYENARSLTPREFAWPYYLGLLYKDRGDLKKAITYFELAQELRPNDIPLLVNLADAYSIDGQLASAKVLYEKALRLDNSNAAAMAGLGRIALSDGDYTTSIRYLESALKLQPQALSLHYTLAMAYRKAGDITKALANLKEHGRGEPKLPDPLADDLRTLKRGLWLLWNRGSQAMAEGRYTDAVKLLDQMVAETKDDPLQVPARIYLGVALVKDGNLQGAMMQYQEVLRISPNNATAHYNLGVILLQLNAEQAAIVHFRTAAAIDPSYKLAHFQLANLLMRSRHYDLALPEYEEVIELSPNNEFAYLMKSLALMRLHRYREAKAELERAVTSFPESTDLAAALARLLAACPEKSLRDGPSALRLAEQLLKSNRSPEFEIVETYGMALASVGRFREAADLQRRMIAALESSKRDDLVGELTTNLGLYERGEASSVPWRDNDPIWAPEPGKMMLQVPKHY